jgi:SAM-dependent methyltransferase
LTKLWRTKILSVSQERWRKAQNAEKQSFNHKTTKSFLFKSEFFSENFKIDAGFFTDKYVLEVGCSPLAIIHGINNARLKLGIEPLADEWSGCYEKSTSHVQGIGEFLPINADSVDVVLCVNVLDHVKAPSQVLIEIWRCLKKGSTLLLWLQTFSAAKQVRKLIGRVDTPHPHHFSDDEVFSCLKESGYGIAYHKCRRASTHSAISLFKSGMFVSGMKSLFANIFLRLHESSFVCTKTVHYSEKIQKSDKMKCALTIEKTIQSREKQNVN